MKESKKVFGTQEWASTNANFINGCSNDCKYCYAKSMAIRYKRKTPDNWMIEEINIKKFMKNYKKKDGPIMFHTTHDITPENVEPSMAFLGNLLESGNDVLVVTKPHLDVVEKICDTFAPYKDKILFRFTIGSCDTDTLKFWEPNAPSFEERLQSLKLAYEKGFKTSVSSEPLLDTNVVQLADILLPYVTDAMWIGKPNQLLSHMKRNGVTDSLSIEKAKELLASLSDKWILELYEVYKDNPKIKWKESIKKVVNIEVPTVKGLDI